MKIIFATNNAHKLEEIRAIMGDTIEVLSLSDIGCHADIPETADTLEGNAVQKAQYIWQRYHTSVFADDTGLEVDALGGAPGVHSARYADGTDHDSEANMQKLLREMQGKSVRTAHFRTVIALILAPEDAAAYGAAATDGCGAATDGGASKAATAGADAADANANADADAPTPLLFEGRVEGTIATAKHGTEGFGYDPLFVPQGYDKSFAQLGNDIKNGISHRARAVAALCSFLKKGKG